MEDLKVSKLALLNDEFRKKGAGVVLTRGAEAVSDVDGLINRVRSFDSFDENNDPWGEHDFGRINWRKKMFSGRSIISTRLSKNGKTRFHRNAIVCLQ